MLKDTQMLVMELTRQGYKVPLVRIGTLVKQGKLFRIIRGLYTDTRTIDPFTVSAAVLQPSYISFESALSVHGLIPVTRQISIQEKRQKGSSPFREGKSG